LQVESVKPGKYNKIKKRPKQNAQQTQTDSEEEENSCNINFGSLQVSIIIFNRFQNTNYLNYCQVHTLRKYKKTFKLKTAGLNKNDLISVISKHFMSIPVQKEKEIIAYFIYNVKNSHNEVEMNE
jgi:hypothetical protein